MENITKHIIEDSKNQDSLEIGTPSKGGAIKIYGDFNKKEEFKARIDNAIALKEYANKKIGNNETN
jgi:hypothetical protein